ncbi:hypothetical protein BDD12DRAFT_808998 [Trichophaea hybrida]|nr:hypothetical protein BDD12DRAFT_808998 [Trichophaea hybrida]
MSTNHSTSSKKDKATRKAERAWRKQKKENEGEGLNQGEVFMVADTAAHIEAAKRDAELAKRQVELQEKEEREEEKNEKKEVLRVRKKKQLKGMEEVEKKKEEAARAIAEAERVVMTGDMKAAKKAVEHAQKVMFESVTEERRAKLKREWARVCGLRERELQKRAEMKQEAERATLLQKQQQQQYHPRLPTPPPPPPPSTSFIPPNKTPTALNSVNSAEKMRKK